MQARDEYAETVAHWQYHSGWCRTLIDGWACTACVYFSQWLDAASIRLDLAVAEASRQRIVQGVAW